MNFQGLKHNTITNADLKKSNENGTTSSFLSSIKKLQ